MIQEFQMVRQAGEAREHIVNGSRLRLNEEDPFTICSRASPACLPASLPPHTGERGYYRLED